MGLIGKSISLSVAGNIVRMPILKQVAGAGFAAAFSGPMVLGGAVNKIVGVAKGATNAVTPQVLSYGKRGIDGNRLAANNLVQNLHKNRRH